MPSIKKINESILELSTFVESYITLAKKEPNNLSHKLAIQSLESQIAELQNQLYKENLKREKEIIQLRLKGKNAKYGSFPLSLVGGLTNSFSKSIFYASKYFQFGIKGGVKIDKFINNIIDLRLEGLEKGSTIFYLSANTSPDLFGNSVIQNSLNNTFELLNSDSLDKIIDNISIVGSHSIKYFSNFLKVLNSDEMELEMIWHSPDETVKVWDGSKERIISLYTTLNSLKLSEPEEIDFEGEIITLSLKGKFEIISKEKEHFNGKFPYELTNIIKQLHVGDFCKGIILKTTILNSATGKEKYEYSLKSISI